MSIEFRDVVVTFFPEIYASLSLLSLESDSSREEEVGTRFNRF